MHYLIQQAFSAAAATHPQALLAQDHATSVTYAEAEAQTNQLARLLRSLGVRKADRVAFCMPKRCESYLSLLAILKADATYVPLDAEAPVERILSILKDAGCSALVTDAATLSRLPALGTAPGLLAVVCFDTDQSAEGVTAASECTAMSTEPRDYESISEDLAYIVFTSGSTGRPKGVMIPHRAVLDYARWTIGFFNITSEDRLTSHAGLHFDLSVFDLFTALLSGASLHPVPSMASMFPAKFLDFLKEREITVWCSVPSFLTYQAKSGLLERAELPSLRAVTCCGEALPGATAACFLNQLPQARLVNQYGPSETTCASMFHPVLEQPEDPCATVPIGRAIPNTEVFALNESGAPISPGEQGELFIRGAGNAPGYWNDKERTASAFIQNPQHDDYPDVVYATGDLVTVREDGCYEFQGRRDHQIKYMGYRIELGEIESALHGLDCVREACVLALDDTASGSVCLTAFLSMTSPCTPAELRPLLGAKLPAYMIPKRFEFLDDLPHNRNGKIDRKTLEQLACKPSEAGA
jgi:amino acid adenylation domain-containing protein